MASVFDVSDSEADFSYVESMYTHNNHNCKLKMTQLSMGKKCHLKALKKIVYISYHDSACFIQDSVNWFGAIPAWYFRYLLSIEQLMRKHLKRSVLCNRIFLYQELHCTLLTLYAYLSALLVRCTSQGHCITLWILFYFKNTMPFFFLSFLHSEVVFFLYFNDMWEVQ